jgi:hypothetical protein
MVVPTREEVIKWIHPGTINLKHISERDKRVANSGIGFFNCPEFKAWLSGEANRLYCPGLRMSKLSIVINKYSWSRENHSHVHA